jgi:hypothetical protein
VAADGQRLGLTPSCGACHSGIDAHDKHHVSPAVSQCSTCHDTSVSPPTPLSEWDRTKLDVRGEKAKSADPTPKKEDKPKAAVCEPGNLQTLVAGVLAANAKHVRHLGEKEGVTVVVTFDEGKAAVKVFQPITETYLDVPQPPRSLPAKPGFTPEEVKALTLGDLHLKQGKSKEACDAYSEALTRFFDKPFKATTPAALTAEQKKQYADEFQKGVRDAMKSYAKALLLNDQPVSAKLALEMATEFVVQDVTPTVAAAKTTAPAKLILTVSKADIDGAKDAAAFKKAVKVERVNFSK